MCSDCRSYSPKLPSAPFIRDASSSDDPLTPRKLDLSKAVRGKYFNLLQEGTNVVLIAPDLLETFPDSESVNLALRSLKQIAERTAKRA